MNKSLYFIECTANSDFEFDNGHANCQWGQEHNYIKIRFKKGDVVYFNPKASSDEMYVGYGPESNPYRGWSSSHLPFTRQKRFAKKWQIKEYAEKNARYINAKGHFTAVIKEIKLKYTEEEV